MREILVRVASLLIPHSAFPIPHSLFPSSLALASNAEASAGSFMKGGILEPPIASKR